MPSTTSSSVANDFASSTVITPSLPTFCIASAIMRPISTSPLALTVAIWAISSLVETFLGCFRTSSTTTPTAISTPRFKSIGFMPATTAFAPSWMIALRENGRRGGAVAGELAGLHGNLLKHLGTHVLKPIGELDFFGDGSAVLAGGGRSVRFVEKDIATFRSQCDLDRICERVDPPRSIFSRAAVPNR